jgi:fluoroquinolone transport system permease protein
MRVLVPADMRLIWRDGLLLTFLMVAMPLLCLGLNGLVPFIGDLVAEWVELEPYYGLILANILIAGEPVLLGFVIGILFIEERDAGTLLALQASPLSLRSFVGYRLVLGMALNVVLTVLGVLLTNYVSIPWPELLATVAVASLSVPVVALVYVVYLKNKVQAIMLLKPVQIWGGVPTLLFFVPTPWQWIGSVAGPLYYPMRLFWGGTEGQVEWWLIVPGVIIPGVAIFWLLRRFERTVYA